ncbi:MAG: DNA gyrase inhibitor YacG [Xanthobacteraceae bacterium]|nr:DNA gyrase inhibitor YacG [Xanthobacteraceae bacterium]
MSERDTNGSASSALLSARRCPICEKPAVDRFRPFCSKRCADVDLHRWLSGTYAIPVKEAEDEDGSLPGQDAASESEEPNQH